jgi:hypothetical protein
MKQPSQQFRNDNLSKLIDHHSKAIGHEADPGHMSQIQRTAQDTVPDVPAGPLRSQLSWNGGNPQHAPLVPPQPDHLGQTVTSTPRVDTGLHGVNEIVNGRK